MTSIAEFLTARLDADEEIARRHTFDNPHNPRLWSGPDQYPVMTGKSLLAEVATKRAILALHTPNDRRPWGIGKGWQECTVCFDPGTAAGEYDFETWPCPTLRALAQPYADHHDFDRSWKP